LYPILFRAANMTLYSYSVCMALALLAGIGWALWAAPGRDIEQGDVLEGALLVLAAAVGGARLFETLGNWDYFRQSPGEIFRLWQGNFAFQGGLVAGVVALFLYSRWRRLSFWALAGVAAPGTALATAFGWLGALLHGANYGIVSSGALAIELPDLYGIAVPRFPTQLAGLAWSLILFAILALAWRRGVPARTLALLWLLLYAGGMFGLGFTRADETLYFGVLRIAQIFFLAEGMTAGIALLVLGTQ